MDSDKIGLDPAEWWDRLREWILRWAEVRGASKYSLSKSAGVGYPNFSKTLMKGSRNRLSVYQFGRVCAALDIPPERVGQAVLSAAQDD